MAPGTVVCGSGENEVVVLAALTAVVNRWPWVIPCIEVPMDHRHVEMGLLLISEMRDRLAVLRRARGRGAANADVIVAAVRGRPAPNHEVLNRWLGVRLGASRFTDALAKQVRHALGGPAASHHASAATYSRVFARHGEYTARDWRAIARLCVHFSAQTSSETVHGLPMRTAAQYVRKYLCVPYHSVAQRVGWEWILEEALRCGHYVQAELSPGDRSSAAPKIAGPQL